MITLIQEDKNMPASTAVNLAKEMVDLLDIFEPLDENLVSSFNCLNKNSNVRMSSYGRRIALDYGPKASLTMVEITDQIKKFAQGHDLTFAHPSNDLGSWGITSGKELIGSITITNDHKHSGLLLISVGNME